MNPLEPYGWNDSLDSTLNQTNSVQPDLLPARVLTQERGLYRIVTALGEATARIAGRLRYTACDASELPVVGDWVRATVSPAGGEATIHAVLPRRSALSRMAVGRPTEAQVLAANVDTVLLVCALNQELNLRRIERYLTSVWESGAAPALVLNKTDLCPDLGEVLRDVEAVAPGVPVHAVSALHDENTHTLRGYLDGQRTVVLVGSSGVGKSTLTNALLGEAIQAVQQVREGDDKGRHTTTRRDLILAPGGGCLIDTPGLRELALWDGDEGAAFPELRALSKECRFNDCRHEREPGCAIRSAIDHGDLDPARYTSYQKLRRELERARRKADKKAEAAERRKRKRFAVACRQRQRLRDRW